MNDALKQFFPRYNSCDLQSSVYWYPLDSSFGDIVRISVNEQNVVIETLLIQSQRCPVWQATEHQFACLSEAAEHALLLAAHPASKFNCCVVKELGAVYRIRHITGLKTASSTTAA